MLHLLPILAWAGLIAGGAIAGWPRGAAGALAGAAAGLAAGPVLWLLLRGLVGAWYACFPLRPRCARGTCGQDDYEMTRLEPDGASYECRCGDAYRRRDGDGPGGEVRFLRVRDGVAEPFMARRSLRWRRDGRAPGPLFR